MNKPMTIKELRTQIGITQKEFGKLLFDIPPRSIQNWEGGQRQCPDYLLKLIEYYLKNENIIPEPPENSLQTPSDSITRKP